MKRASRQRTRVARIGAAALVLASCTKPAHQQQKAPGASPEVAKEAPRLLPKPEPALSRAELIVATLRALTAAAAGEDDSDSQSKLKGRRFEARIRFGCSGADAKAPNGWIYDSKKEVLRVRTNADIDGKSLQPSDLLTRDYEGATGFILRRPWLLTASCPIARFGALADGPTIAIVQLFSKSDSRVQRPERKFEAVVPEAGDQLPRQGLDLVLAGRLEPLADNRPIHCAAAEGAPVCIVSSKIDRVAIEDPARDAVLAEWTPS